MDAIDWLLQPRMPAIKNKEIALLRSSVIDNYKADIIFTTFIENDTDASMTEERAEDIINRLPEGDYRLQVTFIKHDGNKWIAVEGRDAIKKSNRKDNFILNKNTAPGALVGIDSLFYDASYPVTVVIYSAYKIKEPDEKKLQPMRHPGNCVAKLIREYFTDSTKGGRLTDERRKAIRQWEWNTKKSGGTIEAIKKLEVAIKRKIAVLDIMGGFIYPGTHKYNGAGPAIKIYQHNGHAWRDVRFPRKKRVEVYEKVNPLWTEFDIEGNILHDGSDFIKENSIWLLDAEGTQFITQDGTLYRPQIEDEKIKKACEVLGEDFREEVFCSSSLDFVAARKRNNWKPTPKELPEIAKACVEHGHGGLWNMEYKKEDYVSLDMKHCYPASFKGLGDCEEYYKRYGHPDSQFFRVALDGRYESTANGFVKLTTWRFKEGLHPIIYAWYGRHIEEKGWLPVPLLKFFEERGLLQYTAHEAILCHGDNTQWLPEDNHAARIVIGKFTQGARAGEKYMQRRLITDEEELNFLIKKAHAENTMVRTDDFGGDGKVLCYYNNHRAQYYHLRASMLAYAHINLLTMLLRFDKDDVPRVATDSLYIRPEVLEKMKMYYVKDELAESGQWRIKNEEMRTWRERVKYNGGHKEGAREATVAEWPSVKDPISYKRFSYLYGAGGSGKTTRVLRLFPQVKVLTPTHRLERELTSQGYDAQTYHSFFRYTGDKWVPEAIKEIPPVILWDEICTVPLERLKEFVEFLRGKTQVIFAGDPCQPPPISGEMPHEWLKELCYSEEINTDYRSQDAVVKNLKSALRGQSDQMQSKLMRKKIRAKTYEAFLNDWHPQDLVLSSRRASQARIEKDLLRRHKEKYNSHTVPVSYRPRDTRVQKRNVRVPYTDVILENAVTHDRVWLPLQVVEQVIKHPDWRLGYCMTVHSAQGLTIKETLWIIDQRLCWSNLIYTAISRVEYSTQLKRAWGPQMRYDDTPADVAEKNINKKLLRYKRHDEDKKLEFDLCVADVYKKDARCAKCNIPLLWSFEANDDQQFSVDRLNNKKGHARGNIRLTCLECNQKRGAALL